jgi:chromosome segregation protein
MRLKRLELFGFKSFADRTVLEFPNEFTGIVGPNGCGKSNVVDAVRWVLGETRPTSMRGGEMTDVIFKGSTSRPGMGLAEVTLVLDNDCNTLPLHGKEVSVTRRVHKSGEGEYEIDGSRVRLKDVRDLLFDTGLGSRGYAVLEQGKIDAVLSANPQDRRSIFEEAAGISRFRQRRKETESRLKRVDQDMERIDSILRELKSQERSLKIQAGKAERWVEVRDAWRTFGVSAAQHQLHDQESRLGTIETALADHRANVAELRERRSGAETEIEVERARVEEAARAAEHLSQEASRAAADLSGARERRQSLIAHRESAERTAREEAGRIEALGARLAERDEELAAADRDVEAFTERATALGLELEAAQEATRQAEKVYRQARDTSRQLSDAVAECLQERTASISDLRHAEEALAPADERLERARELLATATARVEEARETRTTSAHDMERADSELVECQGRAEAVRAELDALSTRIRTTEEERGRLEIDRASIESRIQALLDREREWETLEDGARALLERAASGSGELPPLDGILADHMRVQTRYARALDAALGAAAMGIVVDGSNEAEQIGAWLRTGRLGQARLVFPEPLNPGRCEPGEPELPYSLRDSVIGCLLDHVEVDAGYGDLARVLLCDCLLVQNLDTALALAEYLPGWRFATPEGDLVDAAGVTTGYAEVGHGAVGRRSEAHELRERADELTARIDELARTIATLDSERERFEQDSAAARTALEAAAGRQAQCRSAAQHAEQRLIEAEQSLDERRAQATARETERAALEEHLVEARERRDRAQAAFEAENTRLSGVEAARAELEEQRMGAESRTQSARVALAQLEADQRAAVRRAFTLRQSVEETRAEIERSRGLAERHAADAERSSASTVEIEAKIGELEASEAALSEQARAARDQERALRTQLDELRRSVDGITEQLERQMQDVSRQELEQQRLDLARDELLRRCEEDFKLDREWLVTDFEPDPELAEDGRLAALVAESADLKRQLDTLGPVNLEAVEQLGEVSQRLGFLDGQRTDLADSKSELERTLDTINSESEKLFVETFEEIRGHFRTVFRQLFGGGKADILIEEGVGVLEAGIEIVARPPGREQLPIGLLSGGQRTMTALALLFSVFKSRPSPFCVLDEVDAALDDANVGRFLGMLDGFLDHTQFIVVTHNKGTMAASDLLYGITMETKGVSCRVAVELDDVDEFVPEAIGGKGSSDSGNEPIVELIPGPSAADARSKRRVVRVDETVDADAPADEPDSTVEVGAATQVEAAHVESTDDRGDHDSA